MAVAKARRAKANADRDFSDVPLWEGHKKADTSHISTRCVRVAASLVMCDLCVGVQPNKTPEARSPDYDMLDAMIASALKKLLDKHVHFRKKSKC